MGIWYIWGERRKHVHGEEVQVPARSALAIAALTANYLKAMKKTVEPRKSGWSKPLEGFVKLNVDASFRAHSLQGAVGAVLRDHKGGFVAASNEQLEHVADAGTAEAYALRHGLLLA